MYTMNDHVINLTLFLIIRVSVSVLSVFAFLVPDWILGQSGQNEQSGQNGHQSGINTSRELKFSRFQVHYFCLNSIYSVI